MIRHLLLNMLVSLPVGNFGFAAQGHVADILIEAVLPFITVPVGFVGAHRMLIPLAGKYALAANGFKTAAYTSNPGKQVNKAKRIVRMMRGGAGSMLCNILTSVSFSVGLLLPLIQRLTDSRVHSRRLALRKVAATVF